MCSMHSIVTTFRGADIKVEIANFCAAKDTLIDQMVGHWYSCDLESLLQLGIESVSPVQ